jgi:septal ring factor EnvC (AmiA/AmiB activator)
VQEPPTTDPKLSTGGVCEALERILERCDKKAGKLRNIFEKVLPGENDPWEKRYLKMAKRFGKGDKVEESMVSITEDVQLVVNHHAVKSAKPEQLAELERVIKEMKSVKSSIPDEESSDMAFTSKGNMENYINQDKGYLVVNRDKVETQNFGKT